MNDPLTAPMKGTEHKELGGVQMDIAKVGKGRVKRVVYPPGFHWSEHIKPAVATSHCMHAHVGFIVRGSVEVEFADGCKKRFTAPQVVEIEPGHDGRVIGSEPAVLIEFDFEGDTAKQMGMPAEHKH
jgi:hypothetical protein